MPDAALLTVAETLSPPEIPEIPDSLADDLLLQAVPLAADQSAPVTDAMMVENIVLPDSSPEVPPADDSAALPGTENTEKEQHVPSQESTPASLQPPPDPTIIRKPAPLPKRPPKPARRKPAPVAPPPEVAFGRRATKPSKVCAPKQKPKQHPKTGPEELMKVEHNLK